MSRNLALPKHWSAVTFVDFSFQCELELGLIRQVDSEVKQAHWQELFCLRELIVSSSPRSEPEKAKPPFFLKSQSSPRCSGPGTTRRRHGHWRCKPDCQSECRANLKVVTVVRYGGCLRVRLTVTVGLPPLTIIRWF